MIKIYNWKNDEFIEITHYCSAISISGSNTSISRQLQLTLLEATTLNNNYSCNTQQGDVLYVELDGSEIFRGIVMDRDFSDNSVTITALNYCVYLNKSKVTFNFSNITAEQATRQILKELSLEAGNIAETGISINRLIANKSAYEAIMELYTQVSKQTGKKYRISMTGNKVSVDELGYWINDVIKLGYNIISYNWKDSMGNMVNRVKIYDKDNNYINTVETTDYVNKYGVFQEIYSQEEDKDYNLVAKNMLKGIEYEVSLELLGDYNLQSGYAVTVDMADFRINGDTMYITSDSHTWDIKTDSYKTSLTLIWQNIMDEKGE